MKLRWPMPLVRPTGPVCLLGLVCLTGLVASACAGGGDHLAAGDPVAGTLATEPGPDAVVPVFAADDERTRSAGFVASTLQLHAQRGEVRHTLMAFVVGDTLTLGAMVRGEFAGNVRWKVGDRVLAMPFDTAGALRDVPVTGAGVGLQAQGASFRGTTWLNVELPAREWVGDGTPLQLVFQPAVGEPLVMPGDGLHYRVRLQDA